MHNKRKIRSNKMIRVQRILFFLLFPGSLFAQSIAYNQEFTLEEYLNWIRLYHPVMQQAALLENKADASLQEARGGFDPKWFGEYEDKSFDQKNYFRVGEAGLKIPSWWGVDIKLAYLWSNGVFLNPEASLPTNGQAVLGIEMPLLQGVVFDQRRAQVQKAKLVAKANEAERRNLINNLLLEATEVYMEWSYQYQTALIYATSLTLARDRFQMIRESFLQGDKPAIDTLESLIQIQNREIQLNQAQVAVQNAALALSNFLWSKDLVPLEVSAQLYPEDLRAAWRIEELDILAIDIPTSARNHPQLQAIEVKQKQLEIKERLKREQFKPSLNFSYNFLGNGFDLSPEHPNQSALNNLLLENYKWGLTFSYPLLLRKERGGLQLVRLEQAEVEFKRQDKQLQLGNKIKGIIQLLENTDEQLDTQEAMVGNYEVLLEAENEKFRIGESSIFLLNNREQKLIDAQVKRNKLYATFQKLRWKLEWAKGELQ